MALFHVVDDAQVVLRSKGVYRQVKLFARDGKLYAQQGSGFIGLRREGGTTCPSVSWEEIDGVEFAVGHLGALVSSERVAKAA